MKTVTITCMHCGGMFQTKIPESGKGSRGHQHSPGCLKSTQVHHNNGNITKTTK